MTSETIHSTLDCCEYDCPMVLVQVNESMRQLKSGETIEVITDSTPNFQLVLKAWADETRDRYYRSYTEENKTFHYIGKAKGDIRREHQEYSKVISNEELQSLLSKTPIQLIDVREDFEFMLAHIPEAVNVPLSNFTTGLSGFEKDKEYYVICRTGNRSDFACKYMESLGFKNIYNVLPGMSEWAGLVEED